MVEEPWEERPENPLRDADYHTWQGSFAAPAGDGRWCGWMRPGWRPNWEGVPGPDYEPTECDIEVSRRRVIVALREGEYRFAEAVLPAEHAERIALGLRLLGLRVRIGPSSSSELRALTAWASRLGPEWLAQADDGDEADGDEGDGEEAEQG